MWSRISLRRYFRAHSDGRSYYGSDDEDDAEDGNEPDDSDDSGTDRPVQLARRKPAQRSETKVVRFIRRMKLLKKLVDGQYLTVGLCLGG